jgi:selenocysteine-specific elongation factor
MKGFGTVVTGTLISGTIRRDDELEILPGGRRVRVRGVQVHGQSADRAIAGQRTALNLAGASTDDLSRGMTLAPPDTLVATRSIDVKLSLLPSAPHALRSRARVHFHCYSSESIAEVELYGAKKLEHSSAAFARLALAEPRLLLPGDRFIIRQFSPVVTIGGGVVVDSAPLLKPKEIRKLEKQAGTTLLEVTLAPLADFGKRGAILVNRVTRRGHGGLTISQAVAETGWPVKEVSSYASEFSEQGLLIRVQDRLFVHFELKLAQESLLDAVSDFHKRDPLRPGMPKGELQEDMSRALNMASELFEAAISNLARDKKVEVVGEVIRLPGHGIVMKDEEAESKKKIEGAFATAGLKVPALPEVLAGLKIDKTRAQKIVTLLLRDKVLVKVSDDLVFHRSALEQLRQQVAMQKVKSQSMDVALFKEMTGVTRKYAIPLLEYLDRERVTKRIGDSRVIL